MTEALAALDDRTLARLAQRRGATRTRGWLVRRMLLLADVAGLTLSFAVAQAFFSGGPGERLGFGAEVLLFVLITLPVWVVAAKLGGLYDGDEERADSSTADDLAGVVHLVTLGAWLFVAGAWAAGLAAPYLAKIVTFWALAIALVTLARAGARKLARRSPTYLQNTVVMGAGDVGQLVARKLLHHPEYGINVVGFVDAAAKPLAVDVASLPVLGPPEALPELVRRLELERVVVAFSRDSHEPTLELVRALRDLDIQVDLVPRFFEVVGPGVGMHSIEGLALIGLPPLRLSRSSRLLKRSIDLALAGLGIVLLAPLFATIAFLVKLDSPGPVFFRQVRMGSCDQTFRIFKFRTMAADAETHKRDVAHLNKHSANGGDPRMFKIAHDPRVTRVGRVLRRFSLDELPQLLNVLSGEMSLVGPRPLILDEACQVEDWARKRLDLKPGLTGLWQVLGRSEISFEEMLRLDYVYVTSWSLGNDLRLILRTIPILGGRGHGAY